MKNDLLNTLYTVFLDQFKDEQTDKLYKQIRQELPHKTYMRIEPMINELMDRGMERAFIEGIRFGKV